jgi:predicted phosphodiesterase
MNQSLNINKFGAVIILAVIIFATIPLTHVYAIRRTNPDILVQFALLSDSHLNYATSGDEANYTTYFEKAIKQVNAAGVDFILIAGDLTQSGKPDEFSQFKSEISKFLSPVWVVPGNHDIGNKFSNLEKSEHVTFERIESYEKYIGHSWFSANCAGVHIICINSSILSSDFELEKKMWKFLEKEMGTSTDTPTILLMHYPLYLKDPDEPGGYWNVEPAQRARLIGLLKKSNVKMVLTGHLHRPVVNNLDGILFVTAPSTSFGIPAGKQPEGWMLISILKNGKSTVTFQTIK